MADTFFSEQWASLHAELGVPSDAAVLDQLEAAWGGEGRFYHSLSHLRRGLYALDAHDGAVALVRLAWFFHDAIYVVGQHDNEKRSAEWFVSYARQRGLAALLVERGERLILMTKDHQGAVSNDPLWPIMNDVDLEIFKAPRDTYDEYANNVWREYQPVATRQQFVLGRAAFMQAFMSRPIFLTAAMKAQDETARSNIEAEIARLCLEALNCGWLSSVT